MAICSVFFKLTFILFSHNQTKTNKMHVGGQILNGLQLLHYFQKAIIDDIVFQGTFDQLFQAL